MIASIVWNVNPVAFSLGSLQVRWYGILWAVGIFLALLIIQKTFKHEHCPDEWGDKIFLYGVLGVIIGARLGHCWFYEWHLLPEPVKILGITFNYGNPYLTHPIELLKVWEGGLSSHGGAVGLLIAMWLYNKRVTHKGYIWGLDHLVIGVCITGALIRLGNLMNSEIVGKPTDVPWAFIFHSHESLIDGIAVPRHPAQLYEALAYLVIFICGVIIYRHWHKTQAMAPQSPIAVGTGFYFGYCLATIFTFRFFVEFLKKEQVDFEQSMPLDMGQLLSLPFVLLGVWCMINAKKKQTK